MSQVNSENDGCCEICDKNIPENIKLKRFCSYSCRGISRRKKQDCKICGIAVSKVIGLKTFHCSDLCRWLGKSTARKHCDISYCRVCSKVCKRTGAKYCSYTCRANDIEDIQKKTITREATNLKKYGSTHTLGLPQVKKPRIKTLKENKEEINEKRKLFWTEENKEKVDQSRRRTLHKKYGPHVNNTNQIPGVREKAINTWRKNHGVENPFLIIDPNGIQMVKNAFFRKHGVYHTMLVEEIKQKVKDTCRKNFGTDWYLGSDEWRKACNFYSLGELDEYQSYRREVHILTQKNKKRLFEEWDGLCYYTGEKLITDKSKYNDPLYATIDHKYSVSLGFMNGIPADAIGSLDNLCVASRYANTKKQRLNEDEFREKLKEDIKLAD